MTTEQELKDAERSWLMLFLTNKPLASALIAALVAVCVYIGGWASHGATPAVETLDADPCCAVQKAAEGKGTVSTNSIAKFVWFGCVLSACHPTVNPTPVPPTPTVVVDAGPPAPVPPTPNAHPFVQPTCNPPTLMGPDPKKLQQYRDSLRPRRKVTRLGFTWGLAAPVVSSVGWLSNDKFCGNQGNLGACEAFTQLDIATTQPRTLSFATQSLFDAAAVNAYKWITANDDIPGVYPPDDTGSDSLSGCAWLVKNGYAKSCQVLSGASAVKVAIQSGPVIVGMNWPDVYMQPDRCGNMPTAVPPIDGGHAVAAMQYDAVNDVWDLLNHWDQTWGAHVGEQGGHFVIKTSELFGTVLDADFVQPVQ
jgi:hypothetical protein